MAEQIKSTSGFMSVAEGAKVYADFRAEVTKAGILKRTYFYYILHVTAVFYGLGFSLFSVITTDSLILTFIWSIVVAFFAVQFGGLMHDAGHAAIAKTAKVNDFLGHIFSICIAMSYHQWKTQHNEHHAHTNESEEDPDLDVPLLSFTKERFLQKKGIGRFLARYQAYLYYPMGSLLAFSYRIHHFLTLVSRFSLRTSWEMALFILAVFLWFVVPFLVFPLTKALVFFFAMHISSGLYILHIFAPNHKGMPELAPGVKLSFLEQQIVTSRNVIGHPVLDQFYMGLNYQIEHHLFPATPRVNLPRLSTYVQALCRKLNLEYTLCTPIESDQIILRELAEIARSK